MLKKGGSNDRLSLGALRKLDRFFDENSVNWKGDSDGTKNDRRAVIILRHFFGSEWLGKYALDPDSVGSKFLMASAVPRDRQNVAMVRRSFIAESLWNLQYISGFEFCLDQFRGGMVEPACAELDAARILYQRCLPFKFLQPNRGKGGNPDFEIEHPNGCVVFGEAKCKLGSTDVNEKTVYASLKKAGDQLPKDCPGVVFLRAPAKVAEENDFESMMDKSAHNFFKDFKRAVAIVPFFTTEIPGFPMSYASSRIGEYIIPSHKFDRTLDWSITSRPILGVPLSWRKLYEL